MYNALLWFVVMILLNYDDPFN